MIWRRSRGVLLLVGTLANERALLTTDRTLLELSGPAALEMVAARTTPVGGVLTDDLATLAAVRAHLPTVPAVITTRRLHNDLVNRAAALTALVLVSLFEAAQLDGWLAQVTAYERERSTAWITIARALDAADATRRERQACRLRLVEGPGVLYHPSVWP